MLELYEARDNYNELDLQIYDLETKRSEIWKTMKETGSKRVKVRTILTTSPAVRAKFEKTELYTRLMKTGAKISSICPLMYTNNPIAGKKPILTSSNKLRTYSSSRYLKDEDILKVIVGKEVK